MMKILYTYLMIRYSVFSFAIHIRIAYFHLLQKLPVGKGSFENHCSLQNQRQRYWKITASLIYSKKISLKYWIMTNDRHSGGLLLDQRDQVLLGMLIQD